MWLLCGTGMKDVRGIGPLWVATEDFVGSAPLRAEVTWIRETDAPYRHGWGLQLRLGKRAYAAGVCGHMAIEDEDEGLLWATQAHLEDGHEADEIGRWRGTCPQCGGTLMAPAPGAEAWLYPETMAFCEDCGLGVPQEA